MPWLLVALSWLPATTLSWTPPTERTDGTPLSPSEINGYIIYQDDLPYMGLNDTQVTVPTSHCYTLRTIDTDGRISGYSKVSCK